MNKFFQRLFSTGTKSKLPSLEVDHTGNPVAQEVKLATAALLIEACVANGELPETQIAAVRHSLIQQFHLNEEALCSTIDNAAQVRKNDQAMDGLAHSLCEAYSREQRTLILALAHSLTICDGSFDRIERRVLATLQFRLGLDEDQAEEARMLAEHGQV